MKETDYSYFLTGEDKIRIAFWKKRGEITRFIVQYSALVNSRWRAIMRIDSCHGYAHKHTFHLHNKEYAVNLTAKGESLNEVFTQSADHIKANFFKIKENYLKN